VLTWVVYDY